MQTARDLRPKSFICNHNLILLDQFLFLQHPYISFILKKASVKLNTDAIQQVKKESGTQNQFQHNVLEECISCHQVIIPKITSGATS